ncbi:hypothetical protein REPUB_Repub20aG0087700 [Reevesia pubescens]
MDDGVTSTATKTASFSSILDKPLSQLSEEDISQLTREDCRKFLKGKGMRRPSWNKSQAIQQVVSLKALLESNDDSGAVTLRKIIVSPPLPPVHPQNAAARVASNSCDSVKEAVFGEEESPYRKKDAPLKPAPVGEISCRDGDDSDNKNLSPRSPCETNELGAQMTIFYCGKVNVYDGVPLDKAREIMHLAATPIDFPRDNLCSGNSALGSFVCHLQAAGDKNSLVATTALQTERMTEYRQQFREKGNITHESDVDGQVNRKASLQRYLEKRKDRFFKGRKNTGQTSSSLEMYLNQQLRTHKSNGQSSRSSTNSPPQSGLPHEFCSSADNQAKLANLSVDLNDEITESSFMAMEAWFMDENKEDQRLPHQLNPNEPVSLDHLAELGVLYWHLNPKDYENDEELKKIREARGYNYMDLLDLCPEKVANYEEKLRNFYTEHIHSDEEIRYCLEGSGYFDVRDKDDRWIRIWIKAGDLIILPAGIYHRFTLDTSNYVKLMRLFVGEPVWTAYNRPQEDHPSRKEYIQTLTEKVGVPLRAH